MKRALIIFALGVVFSQILFWSYFKDFFFQNIALVSIPIYGLVSIWTLILSSDTSRLHIYKLCRKVVLIGMTGFILAFVQWFIVNSFSELERPSLYEDLDPEFLKLNIRVNQLMLSDKKEDLDSALILINRIIEMDEESFYGYTSKHNVLMHLKEYKQALKVNSTLLDLFENGANFLIQRGTIYELLNDSLNSRKYYDLGLLEFEKYLSEDESDWNLKLNYAEALNTSGKRKEALKILEKLKFEYPNEEIVQVWEINDKETFMN